MVVLSETSDEFSDLAAEIAEERDESLVTDATEINDSEPVIYVAPPDSVDDRILPVLQQRHLDNGPVQHGFGIVTGYTPERARQLYFEETDYSGDHCILYQNQLDQDISDESLICHSHHDMTVDQLRNLNEEGFQSLSLQTAGWAIHLNFLNGYLCGYPSTQSVDDYPDAVEPYCVRDGERECPWADDEKLLPAEDFKASHIFVAACATMIANTSTGLPVHAGMGLLSGADSMIGGYRVDSSHPSEVILHYCLLNDGYSLAERCYILNKNAHTIGFKAFPYVAFGKPESTLSTARKTNQSYELTSTRTGVVVDVEEANGHVVDVSIPIEEFPETTGRIFAGIPTDVTTDHPSHYVAFREGESVRVILYGAEKMACGAFQVEISTTALTASLTEVASESAFNTVRNEQLTIQSRKSIKQGTDLRNKVGSMSNNVVKQRFHLTAHRTVADELESVLDVIRSMHEELRQIATANRPFFGAYAKKAMEKDAYLTDGECTSCGRSLFAKRVTDSTGRFERELGYCSACGPRYDVPVREYFADTPRPTVSGDLWEPQLDEREITISFTNTTEKHMYTTLSLWLSMLESASEETGSYIEPSSHDVLLAPGEQATATFTIHSGDLPDTEYKIYAYAIGNAEPYVGIEKMLVGSHPGFRRWSLLE